MRKLITLILILGVSVSYAEISAQNTRSTRTVTSGSTSSTSGTSSSSQNRQSVRSTSKSSGSQSAVRNSSSSSRQTVRSSSTPSGSSQNNVRSSSSSSRQTVRSSSTPSGSTQNNVRNSSSSNRQTVRSVSAPSGSTDKTEVNSSSVRSTVRTINRSSGSDATRGTARENLNPAGAGRDGRLGSATQRRGGTGPEMNRRLQQIRPTTPVSPNRIHPRQREVVRYDVVREHYFYAADYHYFGRRIYRLPTAAIRIPFLGTVYFCCEGIYYRPYGDYYVVCRPPFGVTVAVTSVAERFFRPVYVSYYPTVHYTYSNTGAYFDYVAQQNRIIAENNETIARQQAVIAQNNETIAQQNSALSRNMNQDEATKAYNLANSLGLSQSFADANVDYYYQDGVFYILENNEYKVIIPPAGARVDTLPDDYDLVTLSDGMEYYKVDDTIYMVTIIDGKPYFEVLGQINE